MPPASPRPSPRPFRRTTASRFWPAGWATTSVAEARDFLFKSGIPNFDTPEKAVEAFFFLARHHLNQSMAREVPGPLNDTKAPDVQGARMIIETAINDGRTMLSDTESKAVLKAFHIPTNTTFEVYSSAQAVVAAETLGFSGRHEDPVARYLAQVRCRRRQDQHHDRARRARSLARYHGQCRPRPARMPIWSA